MRTLFLVLIISVLSLSCDKTEGSSQNCPDPQLDCTGINCIINNYYFDFRIVDKNTGADLVFGANPRYTTGDVALYSDIAQTQPIPISADNGARLFRANLAAVEMYLVIGGTTTYKLDATFRIVDCCSSRVKDLKLNGQSLCTCCSDGVQIPVD